MTFVSVVLVSLAASPSSEPFSLAVPNVTCVGMSASLCDSFVDRFVSALGEPKTIRVLAAKDIAQLIGLERQRQLLGCNDQSQCMAELAGALGVDALMTVSFARSAPYFVTTARIVRAKDGVALSSASERVKQEGEIFDSVDRIASKFLKELVASGPAPATSNGVVPFIPGIAGVVVAGVGFGTFMWAGTERTQLETHAISGDAAKAAVEAGRLKQNLGVGLMIGGGAAIVASAIWVAVSKSAVTPAVFPVAGGAAVSLGGTFP